MVVEFSKPIGLKFITLADYLEKILGKRVDLLTPTALKQVPEVRAFRERKKRSVWFRELVENCVVYGDRGYSYYRRGELEV